jgi:hypothetical protein
MNTKKMFLASIAVFLTFQITDFIIHGCILMPTYQALTSVWRSDMMSKMWILRLSSLVMSFFFVYIFIKGYENKGLMEGVRYGVVMGLFMNVIGMFSQYVMYPIPLSLALQWLCFGMIQSIIAGAITALVYRQKKI